MYLFDKEQVKRFFNALENKGRGCEPRYSDSRLMTSINIRNE